MANPHLQYALTRLQGVSTNRVMVEPLNGGGSASPNSLIRFSVPSNTLWDTRGTILSMDAKCTGATLGGRLPPKIDSLINRVSISAGGVQLASGCNLYNVFRHAKDSLTKDHCDSVSPHRRCMPSARRLFWDTITQWTNRSSSTATITLCSV